jgi:hypothetical protein
MPPFRDTPVSAARISQSSAVPLSKDQKVFNALIKEIEGRRALLAEWDAELSAFQHKYAQDLLPLERKCQDIQARLVRALDAAHDKNWLTQGEKRRAGNLILDLLETLLRHNEDDGLKDLFIKHAKSDFDEEEEARLERMKAMQTQSSAVPGEDASDASPDDVLSKRKKSPQQEARTARLEAEEKRLGQSIREVFRKLASALHPDREPDPEERARKTVLMQRANEAYEKGDLLKLLELQRELEHIDRSDQLHLATLRPERLKRYIKILKGQLEDLDMEVQYVQDRVAGQLGRSSGSIRPKDLMLVLKHDMKVRKNQIAALQAQLKAATDPMHLKAWLKSMPLHRTAPRDFDALS